MAPIIGADNGSGLKEDQMNQNDWLLRGTQQATSMLNGLSWQEANAGRNGAPTAGDFEGDWSELEHANYSDKIDDEYYEAEMDQLVKGVFDGKTATPS
jgi:hypothetical protein